MVLAHEARTSPVFPGRARSLARSRQLADFGWSPAGRKRLHSQCIDGFKKSAGLDSCLEIVEDGCCSATLNARSSTQGWLEFAFTFRDFAEGSDVGFGPKQLAAFAGLVDFVDDSQERTARFMLTLPREINQ
jgi:hypothetical protein